MGKIDSVFGYVFKVAIEGYRIIDDEILVGEKKEPLRCIGTEIKLNEDIAFKKFSPKIDIKGSAIVGLYKRFGDLKTEDDFLKFANDYGLLLGNQNRFKCEERNSFLDFEAICFWRAEVDKLSFIRRLHSVCKCKNLKAINKLIKIEHKGVKIIKKGILTKKQNFYFSNDCNGHLYKEIYEKNFSKDIFTVGLYIVQNEVNLNLLNYTSSRLLWNITKHEERRLTLKIYPKNLLGVIWMQFARVINLNNEFKECKICNEPFEVGRGAATKRKNTCLNPDCERAIQEKTRGSKNK